MPHACRPLLRGELSIPSACPYGQRFWVEAPHPLITRARLRDVLNPKPGERVLQVGPGTGYYTLNVAKCVSPGGRLDIFDLQQEMLDHTMRRAGERGLTNITATQGDAQELPYPDASFDATHLITVLGEIPDQDAALRELARVLKPGGRLVVGELFGDPHWVSPRGLSHAPKPPASRSRSASARHSGTSPASPRSRLCQLIPRRLIASEERQELDIPLLGIRIGL